MLIVAILTSIILGAAISLSISRNLKIVELLGLSFPLGIGVQTGLMVLLDCFGIPLTSSSVLISSFLVLIALVVWLFLKKKDETTLWFKKSLTFDFTKLNLLWALFIVLLAIVEVMNFTKCIYFPTFDRDSISAFDLFGKVIANEHTIRNISVFNSPNFYDLMRTPGSAITYVPFTQCSYAYVYMFGAETSKIVNALHFLSFIFVFYGVLSRFTSHTVTAIVTFFMVITPEFLSWSSMSAVNVMHTYYAAIGVLYFLLWFYKKEKSFFWLSLILLMLNVWTRTEGLVFTAACCCILLWKSIKERKIKQLLIFGLVAVLPLVLWNVYLKVFDLTAKQIFVFHPFFDKEKIGIISREVWALFTNTTYYGATFIMFIVMVVVNIYNIFKHKDHAVTLIVILLSILFYTIIIYQIDYIWDSIYNVLRYSYKRFLFCFVPLLWFYVGANKGINYLFEKVLKVR